MKHIEVIIETPKMSFVKRKDDGSIDYISPFPCPFNYGSVPNTTSGDGDRMDAVVLGKKLSRGTKVTVPVVATVHFVDKGEQDQKLICSNDDSDFLYGLSTKDERTVRRFFTFYAFAKGMLNRIRGKNGDTKFLGIAYEPKNKE